MIGRFFSKYAFWIVQILGCTVYALFIFFIMDITGSFSEKMLFFIGLFLAFFIPTTILRFLYSKYVSIDPIEIRDVIKAIFILGFVVLITKDLPYFIGFLSGKIANIFDFKDDLKINSKAPEEARGIGYIAFFIICSGWTFFYFIIKGFRLYLSTRLARIELKDEIKQAQLNTLKGHLNPKFIMSSLQLTKELMQTDVNKARSSLTKLSEILRYSLTKNNINSVSLEEELEMVRNYIELLDLDKQKHPIFFEIDSKTLNHEIPPMLFMSLMELGTQHGMLQSGEEGQILLTSNLDEAVIIIKLIHSGEVHQNKDTKRIDNVIDQRLKLLFEEEAKYSRDHELSITTHLVKIPINE